MKFDPVTFYDLLLVEASLIVSGNRKAKEQEFNLMQIAMINAIGQSFGGKGFKAINPFENNDNNNEEGKSKKKLNRDDLLSELEEIKKGFRRK